MQGNQGGVDNRYMIHLYDNDPRQYTDTHNYQYNHGSFAVVHRNLNVALRDLGRFSELADAQYAGRCDALDFSSFLGKKSFIIHVWEASKLSDFHKLQYSDDIKVLALSEQVADLWKAEGINAPIVYAGVNADFWNFTNDQREWLKTCNFCITNSSNFRSAYDLIIPAWRLAFEGHTDVRLLIKDTNDNRILKHKLDNKFDSRIQYINARWSMFQLRELYQKSHICINVQRAASFGLTTLESMACGCLSINAKVKPSTEIVNNEVAIMVEPHGQMNIAAHMNHFNAWGLNNCYGQFLDNEMNFWNFDKNTLAASFQQAYELWKNQSLTAEKYRNHALKWSWNKSAQQLIKALYD